MARIRTLTPERRWILLAAAISALVVWHAWFSQFNHDEIEHLHAAWLVARGQRPFSDFLEQHHPTLWYLLAPAVARFSSVHLLVFAARLFDLACLLALLAAFVRLLRRVHPTAPARWPTLLLVASFMFVRNMMEVRPDPLMNALVVAGLLSWIAFLQEGRATRALVAGLAFGAAVAVLQKALVVLALAVAASIVLAILRRGEPRRAQELVTGAAWMLLGAAAPVAALVASVSAAGFWRDFWFWNYEFNRFFYLQAVLTKHFSVLVTLGLSLAEDPVLWIAGGAGIVLCARELWVRRSSLDRRDEARIALLVVTLGYLPFLCLNRFPLEQYFLPLLPLLALFSAEAFARASAAPRPRVWLERSALFMAVALGGILALYPGSGPQRELQTLVLAATAPGDAIFVPPPHNPIFRRDGAYFWYNGALIGGAYAEYCRIHPECRGNKADLDDARWASDPPAFVYLDHPEYHPFRWGERSRAYEATAVPRLWCPAASRAAHMQARSEQAEGP